MLTVRVLVGLFLALLVSCGEDVGERGVVTNSEQSIHTSDLSEERSGLFVYKPAVWPREVIPVCWESANAPSLEDKKLVKDAILSSYEQFTSIHFAGWRTCGSDRYAAGIRIRNVDDRAQTFSYGTLNGSVVGNMNLNFTMSKWNSDCLNSEAQRKKCIQSVAVHEFGHSLSAAHEQYRPDVWPDCHQFLYDTNQDKNPIITDSRYVYAPSGKSFDIHSVMNYCNNGGFNFNGVNYTSLYGLKYNNYGVLSDDDAAGLREYYGAGKMKHEVTTISRPTGDAVNFSLWTAAGTFKQPDLFAVAWKATSSGKVEVYQMPGSTNYSSFSKAFVTPLLSSADQSIAFSYLIADYDQDGLPDLFAFSRNPSTSNLEIYILSGASNWQKFILTVSVPITGGPFYKVAIGDYDGDGKPDVFVVDPTTGPYPYISILSGARQYQQIMLQRKSGLDRNVISECSFVVGDFYTSYTLAKNDLICMRMPRQQSAPMSIINISALSSYTVAEQEIAIQLKSENGLTSYFGLWNYGPTNGSDKPYFPGEGVSIGYIKGTGAPTAEVHFLETKLYL